LTSFNGRQVHMIHDVQHLLKNIRNGTLMYTFHLPSNIVTAANLKSTKVDLYTYLRRIVEFDEDKPQKFCPKLKQRMLDMQNSHFNKMRVVFAQKIFDDDVAAALDVLSDLGHFGEDKFIAC